MSDFEQIRQAIEQDPANANFTRQGIKPLYSACPTARINIIGQAPGRRAEEKGIFWDDPSGDRLRAWLGVTRDEFYHSGIFAILPMDFYFPGKGKSGDLPPRRDFAAKWHPQLLELMPDIQLTILIGAYANRHYLGLKSTTRLTEVVRNYQQYLPEYFPLVHPSPRNQIWMKKNPWFARNVLPDLQSRVHEIMENK